MAFYRRPDMREPRKVKNLGWLLRHWQEVDSFAVAPLGGGRALLVAYLRDGGSFWTEFASETVLADWLTRPVFRDVPVTIGTAKP